MRPMTTEPIIVESDSHPGRSLRRADVRPNDGRDEDWLQELIFSQPTLLPAHLFDERYGPLIPIGREVACDAGSIDNLYVSPHGFLTIVETKLWKNPEKHRSVVAQIIDYAKEVARWDIETLNRAVADASEDGKTDLDAMIQPHLGEGRSLASFHEALSRRILVGDFLLLIVGDRISPNAAMLSKSIAGAPGLRFNLKLIELHLYELTDAPWPIVVVPEVVGQTVEQERLIVRIEHLDSTERAKVSVTPPTDFGSTTVKHGTDLPSRVYQTVEDFLTDPDLDAGWEDVYRRAFARWREIGGTLRVLKRWVYWMFDVDGESREVIRCQEYRIGIVRERDFQRLNASASAREEYQSKLASIGPLRKALTDDKMLVGHEQLTLQEAETLMKATIDLGQQLVLRK